MIPRSTKVFGAVFTVIATLGVSGLASGDEYAALLREGNALYAEGKFTEAEEKYILSQEEKPDSAAARFNIGNTYFAREDYPKAIDHYQETIGHLRGDRELEILVKYNLATARVRESERSIGDLTDPEKLQTGIGLLREAITGYRDLLEIDPENEKARGNLSVCQLRIKDLFDRLKRLREEQAKKEPEGQSPVEILKQLIAEETEEVGLSKKADADRVERKVTEAALARVDAARTAASTLAAESSGTPASPAADEARNALYSLLQDLENDPSFDLGATEVSAARKDVESGGTGASDLTDAGDRLHEAIDATRARIEETLKSDLEKQRLTAVKALGFIQGVQNRLDNKPPGGVQAQSPPGQPGQPGQPGAQPQAMQPLPPESVEIFEKMREHTKAASTEMAKAAVALGDDGTLGTQTAPPAQGTAPAPAPPTPPADGVDLAAVVAAQEKALESLRKALAEAEKLPKDPNQQQQQQQQQGKQDEKKEEGQDKQEGDQGDKNDQKQDDQQGKGKQGDQEKAEEHKLSEQEAENLLRRFLRRERDRDRQRKRGRVLGGGRTVDKDW